VGCQQAGWDGEQPQVLQRLSGHKVKKIDKVMIVIQMLNAKLLAIPKPIDKPKRSKTESFAVSLLSTK
jgi:hypothetical protein